MRSTMSVTDARRNFSKLLDHVERGEPDCRYSVRQAFCRRDTHFGLPVADGKQSENTRRRLEIGVYHLHFK